MAPKLLEQLADLEIPPPPADFDVELHDKVNRALVLTQLVELILAAMPLAFLELGRALLGFVTFSVTGRYTSKSNKQQR